MKPLLLTILILIPLTAFAWEGFDHDSRHYIDLYKRKGKEVKYYDYSDGKYHQGEILDSWWGGYKLKVFDYETGKIRHFDMERKRK